MKTALFLLLLFTAGFSFAQQSHILYVSFDISLELGNPETRVKNLRDANPAFGEILENHAFSMKPAVAIPSQRFKRN